MGYWLMRSHKQKHVLIDGDLLVYRSCSTKEVATVLECCTYFDNIVDRVLWDLQDFPDDSYTIFLTGRNNFRKLIYPAYKDNRKTGKPWFPKWCKDYSEYQRVLSQVRDHAVKHWNTVVCNGYEADDGISMAAHKYGYKNVIIASSDKDFKQIPCEIYNLYHWKLESVSKQEARKNLWMQVLTGDPVDNIKGCQGIGKSKAEKLLAGCKTEDDYKKVVSDVYQEKEANMELNYHLVHLLRTQKEYETILENYGLNSSS